MLNEIWVKIVLTAVSFITTGLCGYLIAKIKEYYMLKNALKCLLRSQITGKYYVYSELGEIPRYEKENLNYMHEQYKAMGGNSYVDEIMEEINNLPIKK